MNYGGKILYYYSNLDFGGRILIYLIFQFEYFGGKIYIYYLNFEFRREKIKPYFNRFNYWSVIATSSHTNKSKTIWTIYAYWSKNPNYGFTNPNLPNLNPTKENSKTTKRPKPRSSAVNRNQRPKTTTTRHTIKTNPPLPTKSVPPSISTSALY